ncbi:hypothetical protein [Candidatus Oscillochloris fontis]|uniref:hypothetical protein n=1 Tax=Candidatus Oscillochloris fontis TaxID=2496868 RepID=UPI001EE8966B|nr:hypothetical protein [Candidatus Oscillochloris fontis]
MRCSNHAGNFKAAAKALHQRYAPANTHTEPSGSKPPSPHHEQPDDVAPKATDLGNAIRFRRLFGHTVCYVHTWGAWFVWNGTHWAKDDTGAIYQMARKVVRSIYAEAAQIEDTDARRTLARWAMACER